MDVMRKAAHADAEAVKKQIDASIAQSDAIRDAARVFVQPRPKLRLTTDGICPDFGLLWGLGPVWLVATCSGGRAR